MLISENDLYTIMQGIKRKERLVQAWINERNTLGWDEPGLVNKDGFICRWYDCKGLGSVQVKIPVDIWFFEIGVQIINGDWDVTQGSSAHRRLLKWMNQEEMRSFGREYVENTGTHTLMDMPTHRVTKGSDVTLFSHNDAFYFFSNSREQSRLML